MHRPVLLLALPLALLAPAQAQSVLPGLRDEFKHELRHAGYLSFLSSLVDLGVDAEIEGGNLEVDIGGSGELSVAPLAVPIPLDFELTPDLPTLHGELVFGYVGAKLKFYASEDVPGLHTRVSADYHLFAADTGFGPSFGLPAGFKLQALAHGGLAYETNHGSYRGPGSRAVRLLAKKVLFDTDALIGAFGGSLALRHDGLELDPMTLRLVLRYDMRRYLVLDTGEFAPDAPSTSHWLSARAELSAPFATVRDATLGWIGGVGYRRFFADAEEVGFADYVVLLAGLSVDPPAVDGHEIPPLVLLGGVYVGEDVFGWTITFTARF